MSAPPPVFLNHFFTTLDRATFAAVKSHEWLRTAFAPFEERTTRRNDSTYTGIYFYGRSTYFEFFEDGSEPGKVKGASGIALGVETPGAAQALSGVLPDQVLITRQVAGVDAPWFHSASPAGVKREDFFRSWVMEYHADFLKQWHPQLEPHTPRPLRRRDVLDRYVAKIGEAQHRADFLLKDVVGLEINLPAATAERFGKLLDAFAWQSSGATWTGPEIRITVGSAQPHGLRRATFTLQRAVPSDFGLAIGASRLQVSARGTAVWTML